jgi:hypothetical protein
MMKMKGIEIGGSFLEVEVRPEFTRLVISVITSPVSQVMSLRTH